MSASRYGNWITLHSGRKFYPADPHSDEFDIEDIAHSLANQCRFCGHCSEFYSVAQHSVLVSLNCDPSDALWGLLHDASESVLVDVPSPLKVLDEFRAYRNLEKCVTTTICQKFCLPYGEPMSVKIADKKMLLTEARDLTVTKGTELLEIYGTFEPYEFKIDPWPPKVAKTEFLARFEKLTTERAKHANT